MNNSSQQQHKDFHLQSSDILTDIVIGLSDGLTIPFALAAGLTGAMAANNIIIIAGAAATAAGSIAMGVGGYLTGRAELDHYHAELKREYDEVETVPESEKEEVKDFFSDLGLSEAVQEKAVEEMTKDKDKWVDFMMKYELGLDKPNPQRARNSAFNISLFYAIGGIIPLSPYLFIDTPIEALKISALITLISLFIFGFFKSKITGLNPWLGALRVTMISALAAGCAFAVAKLIEH